jgi:phospholipase C
MAVIEHVVVLMLENRSFDSMLGHLYKGRSDFDGLTGNEFNEWKGTRYPVWTSPKIDPNVLRIPKPGPGESFDDMKEQIFGAPPGAAANMSGFVSNYMGKPGQRDPRTVMHGFTPDQLPAMRDLALAFGVSDRWHASAPQSNLAQSLFRPHRHRRRICEQRFEARPVQDAHDLQSAHEKAA